MSYSIAAIPGHYNKEKAILARLQKRNNPGYQRGLAFWGAFDAASVIAKDFYSWQYSDNQEPVEVTWTGITAKVIDELIKIIGEKS